jgi:hypothetical protein
MNDEVLDESLEEAPAAENLEVEQEDEPTGDSPEDIEEAKKYGFKDPDEYEGNPEYQVSAKDYLARRQKGGIIKEKDETISKLQAEMAENTKAVKSMASFHQRQIERTKTDADEAARAKYVRSVDEEGVSGADALNVYEQDKKKIDTQYAAPQEERKQEAPEITKFYQDNVWYEKDILMQGAANAAHQQVIKEYPTLPLGQQLQLVKKQIVERFPDKFENPKKNRQSIEGGGNIHGGASRKKDTLSSLGFSPADQLDVKKAISAGDFKDEAAFIKYYKA